MTEAPRGSNRPAANPVPPITFPDSLPVSARRDEITEVIRDHQVVIVLRRNRLGQDHAVAEDPAPRWGRGKGRRSGRGLDRPHRSRGASLHPAWPSASRRRLNTPLGEHVGFKVRFQDPALAGCHGQADDRRHPARRIADRPFAARLRHDRHRRGARAQPEHRLPARPPAADPAAPAGPEGDRDLGDDRCRTFRPPLRTGRSARAGDPGLGPHVSGRAGAGARSRKAASTGWNDAIGDAVDELWREGSGDVLVFLPANAKSARPRTTCANITRLAWRSCPSSRG